MKHFRKSGGFTLVELVVSIAVASLVTMAATTVLMLALRVNRQTSDTATQQYTVRALLTTMEKAATDGNIIKVDSKLDSWQMIGKEVITQEDGTETTVEKTVFSYSAFDGTISANGIVVLKGVYASNALLEDNGLLSISIETKEGIFESTIYCRLGVNPGAGESTVPTAPSNPTNTLDKFLAALMGELNSSGKIQSGVNKGKYYSQWYIGDAAFNDLSNNWNADTPWCACFVSWALAEAGLQDAPKFADVDKFMAHFSTLQTAPNPGDLVFFDWITDDGIQNPQHVGVVLQVMQDEEGDDVIITIEGNSAGRVTMRRYKLTDERILGYGLLAGLETE